MEKSVNNHEEDIEPKINELDSTRLEFFEREADQLFGEEEMGDPAAQIEPNDLWLILQRYEAELINKRLLKMDD